MTVKRPRLWVVDPSTGYPETEGVEQVLDGWTGSSRVFNPAIDASDGPAPADGYELDGVVVMGSRASVHDDHPWLDSLAAWLRPIVGGELEVPLLAICFGHQLVAHMAGAEVGFLHPDREKLVGVEESEVDPNRLLEEGGRLRVVVSHREEVKTVPSGYRVVARRARSALDGFEHERLPIFTFQFHPEARGDFVTKAGLDPALVDARLIEDSSRVLAAFRDLVARRC